MEAVNDFNSLVFIMQKRLDFTFVFPLLPHSRCSYGWRLKSAVIFMWMKGALAFIICYGMDWRVSVIFFIFLKAWLVYMDGMMSSKGILQFRKDGCSSGLVSMKNAHAKILWERVQLWIIMRAYLEPIKIICEWADASGWIDHHHRSWTSLICCSTWYAAGNYYMHTITELGKCWERMWMTERMTTTMQCCC